MFAYLSIDFKNSSSEFKITDLSITNKKSQKGSKCIDKQKSQIIKYFNIIKKTNLPIQKKNTLCNDLLILFIRKDNQTPTTKWFLTEIEYILYNKIKETKIKIN